MTPLPAPHVNVDVFEGPLDLLLYLIKKNDLDIHDIPISRITSDFLHLLEVMKELNLAVAGEFLVMAATLMQIKARSLLPAPSAMDEEEPDPRADLVHRLLEYQRFKEAARHLGLKLQSAKDIHYRGAPLLAKGDYLMEASLFDLLDAFRDVLRQLRPPVREIESEEVPIERKIDEILALLAERPFASFREILQRETTRRGLIVAFLAVLELIRLRRIFARQQEPMGEIRVYRSDRLPREMADEAADPSPEPAPAGAAEPAS